MIPELGNFCLILALTLCLAQAWYGLYGAWRKDDVLMQVGRIAVGGQFLLTLMAFAVLTWSFLINDFSVAYVAQNSNSALPTMYRIAAVWGAHEGSLLLWITVLSGWTLAVLLFSRSSGKTVLEPGAGRHGAGEHRLSVVYPVHLESLRDD